MGRRPIDFQALRERIPPIEVLRWMDWKGWKEVSGEYRGPCPVHGSHVPTSRSFAVGPVSCYCHRCRWRGDAIDLYAWWRHLPVYEAAIELCSRLYLEVLYRPAQRPT